MSLAEPRGFGFSIRVRVYNLSLLLLPLALANTFSFTPNLHSIVSPYSYLQIPKVHQSLDIFGIQTMTAHDKQWV